MPHQPLLFLPFLPLFISFFFSISSGNTSLSAYCNMSKCGDLEVKYPFYLQSDTTSIQYCGYQGFGLDCSPSNNSDHHLILHLPNDDFYIKNISYTNYTITLVDVDVTTNSTCPRTRQNLTLEDLPLEYSKQDLNLTIYFNCTSDSLPPPAYAVDCLKSGENMSYVSLQTDNYSDFDWFEFCEEKVVATVIEREINNNGINGLWASMFNDGFVLDWHSGIECAKCELSEGHCGYNSKSTEFLCFCKDGTITYDQCKGNNRRVKLIIGLIIGFTLAGLGICTICVSFYWRKHAFFFFMRKSKECQNLEACITQFGSLAPRRYSYEDIKKMTNSFKDKLGQGGFGDVYRGKLFDSRPVAIKILKSFKGSGEEFINEVASISRTSHVNIVTLLGFCFDGHKGALVYEFMPNGSLDKYIYGEKKSENHLGLLKLYDIAVGIARGLEYLHKGCNTRILHFDIKPHNILLDEDFCPKISDFGLAKLCTKKESIISITGARGTIGYIAPELVCRNFGGVSHKSDIYSYGMMLLEMVGGRKNISIDVSQTSEIYFPHWAYHRMALDEDLKLQSVFTQEENEIARKMILVGLWCIQIDPSQRPAVSRVIEMLEGNLQVLEIPPKPLFGSPPRSPTHSSTSVVELS